MNNFLLQMISPFLSKLKTDIEEIEQNRKLHNRSSFANRMNHLISTWEIIVTVDGLSSSEQNRIVREVIENANEVFLIKYLLEFEPRIILIEYEKSLQHTAKTIDLFIELENGKRIFLDVKTIQPENIDAWDKFEQIRQHIHGEIHLKKNGLGGEFWHKMFTARSKMLDYAIELEDKLPDEKMYDGAFMVFCSNGTDWHLSDLEDFADFYKYKKHRWDDFFRNLEKFHIQKNNIALKGNISGFCYFERKGFSADQMSFQFNVNGPSYDWNKLINNQ